MRLFSAFKNRGRRTGSRDKSQQWTPPVRAVHNLAAAAEAVEDVSGSFSLPSSEFPLYNIRSRSFSQSDVDASDDGSLASSSTGTGSMCYYYDARTGKTTLTRQDSYNADRFEEMVNASLTPRQRRERRRRKRREERRRDSQEQLLDRIRAAAAREAAKETMSVSIDSSSDGSSRFLGERRGSTTFGGGSGKAKRRDSFSTISTANSSSHPYMRDSASTTNSSSHKSRQHYRPKQGWISSEITVSTGTTATATSSLHGDWSTAPDHEAQDNFFNDMTGLTVSEGNAIGAGEDDVTCGGESLLSVGTSSINPGVASGCYYTSNHNNNSNIDHDEAYFTDGCYNGQHRKQKKRRFRCCNNHKCYEVGTVYNKISSGRALQKYVLEQLQLQEERKQVEQNPYDDLEDEELRRQQQEEEEYHYKQLIKRFQNMHCRECRVKIGIPPAIVQPQHPLQCSATNSNSSSSSRRHPQPHDQDDQSEQPPPVVIGGRGKLPTSRSPVYVCNACHYRTVCASCWNRRVQRASEEIPR